MASPRALAEQQGQGEDREVLVCSTWPETSVTVHLWELEWPEQHSQDNAGVAKA